jgi:cell division protein FtsL
MATIIYTPPQKKEDEKKVPQKPKIWLNRGYILIIIAAAAFSTILYVGNVIYIDKSMKINLDLAKELAAFRNENDLLRKQLNELQSPQRIIGIAEIKLGMVKAAEAPIVIKTSSLTDREKE